jgi:phage anti-repressor protein
VTIKKNPTQTEKQTRVVLIDGARQVQIIVTAERGRDTRRATDSHFEILKVDVDDF